MPCKLKKQVKNKEKKTSALFTRRLTPSFFHFFVGGHSLAPSPASPARPCSQGRCCEGRPTRRPRRAPQGRPRPRPAPPRASAEGAPPLSPPRPPRAGRFAAAGLPARPRQRAGRFPGPQGRPLRPWATQPGTASPLPGRGRSAFQRWGGPGPLFSLASAGTLLRLLRNLKFL